MNHLCRQFQRCTLHPVLFLAWDENNDNLHWRPDTLRYVRQTIFLFQKYSFSSKHLATKVQSLIPTSIIRHRAHIPRWLSDTTFNIHLQCSKHIDYSRHFLGLHWALYNFMKFHWHLKQQRKDRKKMDVMDQDHPASVSPPPWHGDQELETVAVMGRGCFVCGQWRGAKL